jgi:hypothetical protein
MTSQLFFGPLRRRPRYAVKADGDYYSYAYYRKLFQHEIAEDCCERCVYCDSHESDMGGREAMQLDHFRPYTRVGFEHLENDPSNFHHACGRCNLLKSDWWESTVADSPHDGQKGFIDPFTDLRRDYFDVANDGELIPKQGPAEYLIGLLELNRLHLKRLRELRILRSRLEFRICQQQPLLEAALQADETMKDEAIRTALELLRLARLCIRRP